MTHHISRFSVVFFVTAVLHPPAAGGKQPDRSPPARENRKSRATGLSLRADLGVDGCTRKHCHNADPFLYLRMQMLFRVSRYAAAGLHTTFLFNYPNDPPDMNTTTFWAMILGVEARGILPTGRNDMWVGVVAGYHRWQWDGKFSGEKTSSWFNAFALGWGFGADHYVNPRLGIGFSFYMYKPWPRKMCTGNGGKECPRLTGQDKDEIGVWWSVGFSTTYHLPF